MKYAVKIKREDRLSLVVKHKELKTENIIGHLKAA